MKHRVEQGDSKNTKCDSKSTMAIEGEKQGN